MRPSRSCGNASAATSRWAERAKAGAAASKAGSPVEENHWLQALRNSPFWNNHFYDSERVHVRNVHISAKDNSPNTDGWDPDSARDVLVERSTYVGGDDCVAIKSGWDCFGVAYGKPSRNITIRDVNCTGSKAGIAIGSEMSGGVEDVLVQRVNILGKANGIAHVKTGVAP